MGKQKIPTSKVIRISIDTYETLEELKPEDLRWPEFIDLLMEELGSDEQWALPSQLHPTKQKARTYALELAAAGGLNIEDAEQPTKVRAVPA